MGKRTGTADRYDDYCSDFPNLGRKESKTIEENVEENIKYHAYDNGLLIKEYVVNQTVFYEVVSKVEYKEEETLKSTNRKKTNY